MHTALYLSGYTSILMKKIQRKYTKTLPTRPTARKIRDFSEKGQKNKRALRPSGKTENGECFHTSPVSFADCSIFSAPSIAPSMTGK